MGPVDKARELAGCTHPTPCVIAQRAEWCPFCGALRYKLERASGELAGAEWFRTSGVCSLDELLGRSLSVYAERCLSLLSRRPMPLVECADRFGSAAVLELVFRDLLDVDATGLAFLKERCPSGLRIRAAKERRAWSTKGNTHHDRT